MAHRHMSLGVLNRVVKQGGRSFQRLLKKFKGLRYPFCGPRGEIRSCWVPGCLLLVVS